MDPLKMFDPVPDLEAGASIADVTDYWADSLLDKIFVNSVRLEAGADNLDSASIDTRSEDDDVSIIDPGEHSRRRQRRKYLRWLKIAMLSSCWCAFTLLLMLKHEHEVEVQLMCVPAGEEQLFHLKEWPASQDLALQLHGPFALPTNRTGYTLSVAVLKQTTTESGVVLTSKTVSDEWQADLMRPQDFDTELFNKLRKVFVLNEAAGESEPNTQFVFSLKSNVDQPIPLEASCSIFPIPVATGTAVALLLLGVMCALIIWRLVNYTLAAIFASTLSIGMLAYWHVRPPLPAIVSWIQIDLLMVLFSITIIVAITADTGVLDYLVVLSYELSNGHIWPLLNIMFLLTLLGSAFLDTICTLMFIVPVQIKLCEVLELNPAPVLMCLVIAANIGEAFFPEYDPVPDGATSSDVYLAKNIGYSTYMEHMCPVMLLIVVLTYLHLRLQFFDSSKMRFTGAPHANRLKRVIRHWRHTANTMSGYSRNEKVIRDTIMSKARRMRHRVRRLGRMPLPPPDYEQVLRQLKATYYIRQRPLLYKCIAVLIFVTLMVIVNSLLMDGSLPLGWITLLGAILLLILTDIDELEGMLARIDWSTMLFLAALDILMHVLSWLGLLDSITVWARELIRRREPKSRLGVAILTILWISGLTSAVCVEVSLTTGRNLIMRIIFSVTDDDEMSLPLQPLVWAMFLGVMLGANGTIIGATINIVVAGTAEKHGYDFSFWYFFKIGFPVMVENLLVATVYLWICHVVYSWH